MQQNYHPEVNDYCVLINNEGEETDRGWIYFICPELPLDFNNNRHPRYLTLETSIKPRPICETQEKLQPKVRSPRHQFVHTLLLVYEDNWCNLKYIHSRPDCKSKSYYNRFTNDTTK